MKRTLIRLLALLSMVSRLHYRTGTANLLCRTS